MKCIVKVQTEAYKRGDTYSYGKSLRVLKRMSNYDIISEEVSAVGVIEGLENIINLANCPDGVYEVVVCNVSRDDETGYIDDCNLKLVPYKESKDD